MTLPVYDYQCQHCRKVFEVRASFKERAAGLKPECPRCQSLETRQLLTSGLFLHPSDDGKALEVPICAPDAGPGCCG